MKDLFEQEENIEKAEDKQQLNIFNIEELESWKSEWQDMPEFISEDLTSFQSIIVHFKDEEDRNKFAELIGRKLTYKTNSLWYPPAEILKGEDKRYVDEP